MSGKIYITEKFYDRLEDFISSGIIDKKTFERLKLRLEDLSFVGVEDLKKELHLINSDENVFNQRIMENVFFIYLEKDNNFYLMGLDATPKWR